MAKKLDVDVIMKIRQMRYDGYTLQEIANQLGLSLSTVRKYVMDVRPPRRRKSKRGLPLGEEEKQKLIEMLKTGEPKKKIADELGIHYQTVMYWARKLKEEGKA